MDGPPEIVAGIVMKVMTSCSLRPASRARKPPMAWMPSCELPAMRMTASPIDATLGAPCDDASVIVSLMKSRVKIDRNANVGPACEADSTQLRCTLTLSHERG